MAEVGIETRLVAVWLVGAGKGRVLFRWRERDWECIRCFAFGMMRCGMEQPKWSPIAFLVQGCLIRVLAQAVTTRKDIYRVCARRHAPVSPGQSLKSVRPLLLFSLSFSVSRKYSRGGGTPRPGVENRAVGFFSFLFLSFFFLFGYSCIPFPFSPRTESRGDRPRFGASTAWGCGVWFFFFFFVIRER
ncbi:hypothetical protein V8C37DRAFT_101521 [Trichoderma ceciliae]